MSRRIAIAVTTERVEASGHLGQYRKHSGWNEWADHFPNEQWLMETVFRRAGEAAARPKVDRPDAEALNVCTERSKSISPTVEKARS
jgi:hypothetical protein